LLINTDYPSALDPHLGDAATLSPLLENLGFDISVRQNLDRRAMRRAIRGFAAELESDAASIGFVYFVGYRALSGNQTYLLPVGYDPAVLDKVSRRGLRLSWVLDEIGFAQNRATALFINAYDPPNAEPAPIAGSAKAETALTTIIASEGALTLGLSHPPSIPVSADRGIQAACLQQLAQALSMPSFGFPGLLNTVAKTDSSSAIPSPWIVSGPDAKVLLASAPDSGQQALQPADATVAQSTDIEPATPVAPKPTASPEEAFVWEVTLDGNQPSDYELFLQTYPEGFYAEQARAKLAGLTGGPQNGSQQSAAQTIDPATDKHARIIWDSVKDSDNPTLIMLVAQQFPNTRYAMLAEQRVAELSANSGDKVAKRSLIPQPATTDVKPAVPRSAADETLIANYLQLAQAALQDNRLTTPVEDSTLSWAQQVLAVDPRDATAQALLEQVVGKYLGWASSQYRRAKISRARSNIRKAGKLSAYANPTQVHQIHRLERQIRSWRPPPVVTAPKPAAPVAKEQPQDTWGKVKGWFSQDPAPSAHQDPTESTFSY